MVTFSNQWIHRHPLITEDVREWTLYFPTNRVIKNSKTYMAYKFLFVTKNKNILKRRQFKGKIISQTIIIIWPLNELYNKMRKLWEKIAIIKLWIRRTTETTLLLTITRCWRPPTGSTRWRPPRPPVRSGQCWPPMCSRRG